MGKGVYREIVEPQRIVYTDCFSDADGIENVDMPATEVTLELIDLGGRTKLVNRSEYVTAEALETVIDMGTLQGITQTWDRAPVAGRARHLAPPA